MTRAALIKTAVGGLCWLYLANAAIQAWIVWPGLAGFPMAFRVGATLRLAARWPNSAIEVRRYMAAEPYLARATPSPTGDQVP